MTHCPAIITADVDSQRLLTNAAYFFSGTPTSIIDELIQNARRAGAAHVWWTLTDTTAEGNTTPAWCQVTIHDDGRGIDDPRKLVTLAATGWSDKTIASERPAGFGLWSLAATGASVTSNDWSVDLTPAVFAGTAAATVQPHDPHVGTTITFRLDTHIQTVENAIRASSRFAPLDTYINGNAVERRDFLAGAERIIEWQGLRIGLYLDHRDSAHTSWINFHGLTVIDRAADAPCIQELSRHTATDCPPTVWHVRVDVIDCPQLALKLPDRNAIIQNDFYKQLVSTAKREILKAIADRPIHSLSMSYVHTARKIGIAIADPALFLHPWTPATAVDHTLQHLVPITSTEGMILYDPAETGPTVDQSLGAALTDEIRSRLFLTSPAYIGHPQYDLIPRIDADKLVWTITTNTGCLKVTAGTPVWTDRETPSAVVESILLAIPVIAGNTDEWIDTITLSAPVAVFAEKDTNDLYDWRAFVTAGTPAHKLGNTLYAALFRPSDDSDSDSYNTQSTDASVHLHAEAARIVTGDAAAALSRVIDSSIHALRELFAAGAVTLTISSTPDRGITVTARAQDGGVLASSAA